MIGFEGVLYAMATGKEAGRGCLSQGAQAAISKARHSFINNTILVFLVEVYLAMAIDSPPFPPKKR